MIGKAAIDNIETYMQALVLETMVAARGMKPPGLTPEQFKEVQACAEATGPQEILNLKEKFPMAALQTILESHFWHF